MRTPSLARRRAQLGVIVGIAVGVPFFVLSTTSPLLQRWFAASGHPSARDPYFLLYAASNAGSLLGLLAYPLFDRTCADARPPAVGVRGRRDGLRRAGVRAAAAVIREQRPRTAIEQERGTRNAEWKTEDETCAAVDERRRIAEFEGRRQRATECVESEAGAASGAEFEGGMATAAPRLPTTFPPDGWLGGWHWPRCRRACCSA